MRPPISGAMATLVASINPEAVMSGEGIKIGMNVNG